MGIKFQFYKPKRVLDADGSDGYTLFHITKLYT